MAGAPSSLALLARAMAMTGASLSPSSYICTGNKKGVNLRDKIKKELNNKLKKIGSIQQKKGKEQD
jgi:hypothetical protein